MLLILEDEHKEHLEYLNKAPFEGEPELCFKLSYM